MRDVLVTRNSDLFERRGILALTVSSSVGVILGLGDLVIEDVVESRVHPTTVATFVVILGGSSTVN